MTRPLLAALLLLPASWAQAGKAGETRADSLVTAATPEISLEVSPWDGHACTLRVSGLPSHALARLRGSDRRQEEWERILAVYTGPPEDRGDDQPAMLGGYVVLDDALRFVPRFPWSPGMSYHARFDGASFDAATGRAGAGTPRVVQAFAPPDSGEPAAHVEAIYPSADRLPANLLRLYVQFSAPMLPREVARHVRLLEDGGNEVALPFVEIDGGLWDPTRRRLTLFVHPGRIKQGVGPRDTMGPALVEGRSYRLVIDRELRDAAGRPLASEHAKEFRVAGDDRRSPDVAAWSVASPAAGTRAPLAIDFPEPLDHALMRRLIRVTDPCGEPVRGEVAVSRRETRWEIVPELPWEPGEHAIHVHPALEDVAGNSLAHRFEEPSLPRAPVEEVSIPFTVAGR